MDYNRFGGGGGGFRASLQEATRQADEDDDVSSIDDDGAATSSQPSQAFDDYYYLDWSVHTIDYDSFKSKLRQYSKRRSRIRRKLAASVDDALDAVELDVILGPPTTDVTRADVQALMLPMTVPPSQNTVHPYHLEETELVSNRQQRRGSARGNSARGNSTRNVTYDNDTLTTGVMQDIEEQFSASSADNDRPTTYITMSNEPYVTMPDNFSTTANTTYPTGAVVTSAAAATRGAAMRNFLFGRDRLKRRTIMRHVSNWERNDLIAFLSQELDKVSMFYLAQWQKLTQQFMALTKGGYKTDHVPRATARNVVFETTDSFSCIDSNDVNLSSTNPNESDFNTVILPYARMGKEILELQAFCAINALVLRQILIRYDAYARAYEGTPMMQYYMKTLSGKPFRKILQHKEVLALGDSFLEFVEQEKKDALKRDDNAQQPSHAQYYAFIATQFQNEQTDIHQVVASSEHAEATATLGHAPLQDTLLDTLRYYFLLGMLEDRLGYEPSYLTTRGRSLTPEMRQLAAWRRVSKERWDNINQGRIVHVDATSGAGVPLLGCLAATPALIGSLSDDGKTPPTTPLSEQSTPRSRQDSHRSAAGNTSWEENTVPPQQIFNLFMALTAGFFYCLNYYIVEPSSTMYVNALGAQDAMSATLIGMMPIASFFAAIAYSIWTNNSFRNPFLVSCVLMLTGNIMYASAFNFRSLPMALAGRFMTGLGGPKCIIRRYMADTTSLNIRTSVNALFGMVVAAGSALGPGCAILLNKLNFSVSLIGNTDVVVNGMTGPGWFMALLWSIFLLALSWGFREQDRIGLEEQMQKESPDNDADANNAGNTSNSTHDRSLPHRPASGQDDDLMTLMSGKSSQSFDHSSYYNMHPEDYDDDEEHAVSMLKELKRVSRLVTFPVRICLGLLWCKVFVIETLVSCTSSLSKNRYGWKIHQVGLLGLVNGLCVIPLSILVGKASLYYQDRFLMLTLLSIGVLGLSLLIDYYDLFNGANHIHSVGPGQYVTGYFITYVSIQSFEGVIGSALSKVIPTSLATGTFNSGLLATLVDTFGRSCGDLFISLMGYINIDQLMNLLFIPGVLILFTCLFMVRKYYDLLAV